MQEIIGLAKYFQKTIKNLEFTVMEIFSVIFIVVIIIAIKKMRETPEQKQKKWIRKFVDTTPMEQIYPVGGANSDKISFGSDKVADSLGISTHEAYKLLNIELSRRGLPHE